MNKQNLIVVAIAVVLSVVLSTAWNGRTTIVEKVVEDFGAFPGPEIFSNINIHGTLTTGGGTSIATTTTATTYTFVQRDLAPYSMIDLTLNTGNGSFTLPATSTMINIIGELGASRKWLIHNATTTAATTLTLVAGAGMDLVGVTTADDVIDGGEYTQLICTRIPYVTATNENIACIVDELLNVD